MKRYIFNYLEKTDQKRVKNNSGIFIDFMHDKQLVGDIELVVEKLISHILILPTFSQMVKLWKKNPSCQEKHTSTYTNTKKK